ncbi:hypothetical protein ACROYT_G039144 [Oculina patagonica]
MPLTSRILLLSLAASDLGVGLIVQPINTAIMVRMLAIMDNHGDEDTHGLHLICPLVKTWQFFGVFFAGASLLTIGAISIDR